MEQEQADREAVAKIIRDHLSRWQSGESVDSWKDADRILSLLKPESE